MSSLKLLKYVLFFFNLLFWVSESLLSMAELTSPQVCSISLSSAEERYVEGIHACLGHVQSTQPEKKGMILFSPLRILPQYNPATLRGVNAVLQEEDAVSLGTLGYYNSLLTSMREKPETLHCVLRASFSLDVICPLDILEELMERKATFSGEVSLYQIQQMNFRYEFALMFL